MNLPTSTVILMLIKAKYVQGNNLVPFSYLFIVLLLSSFFPPLATTMMAQVPSAAWTARYNGSGNGIDQAVKTVVDANGNVYLVGTSDGDASAAINNDIVTIKYNAAGVQQWLVRYNGPGNEEDVAKGLVIDANGNVYVTGGSTRPGKGLDMVTIKYNTAGIQQWVQYFDAENKEDNANAIALDASGNVYVTGYATQTETSDLIIPGYPPDVYINKNYLTLKYTSAGVQQWVRYYGSTGAYFNPNEKGDDVATLIVADAAGNVYIVGASPSIYSSDCLLIKYNASGVQQWQQYFGQGVDAYPSGLALDASGNIAVAAHFMPGAHDGNTGAYTIETAKYNAAGTQLWTKNYGDPYYPNFTNTKVKALVIDAAGNTYIAGTHTKTVGTGSGYITIKYNASGVQQWVKTYQGSGTLYNENDTDTPATLAVDATSQVYVTGGAWNNAGGYNYTTIKYNEAGAQQWILQYNGPANNRDEATSLALGPNGSLYITGASMGANQDFATIKYVPQAPPTCAGTGGIRREYWANVKGNTISSIPVNLVPTTTSLVTSFEGPTNVADKYAARYRGYICPPATGQYRFAIAGDNEVELWLSTSQNVTGKQKIAFIIGGYTNPRQWNKYASQQSLLVTLQAGQRYYIEALHKEGTGGDNLSVAWQQPGSATFAVIPGVNLIPFQPVNAREAMVEEVVDLKAFPNPFASELTINFTTKVSGQANLDLYDLQGIRLKSLFDQQVQAGESHQVVVEGRAFTNGLYLIRLVNGNHVSHLKVILAK